MKMSPKKPVTIHQSTIVTRVPSALSTELDNEGVILDMESGLYFGLDNVAQRIWELCQQPIQVSDIIRRIITEFEVEQAQCQQDVESFIQEMLDHKLLTTHPHNKP